MQREGSATGSRIHLRKVTTSSFDGIAETNDSPFTLWISSNVPLSVDVKISANSAHGEANCKRVRTRNALKNLFSCRRSVHSSSRAPRNVKVIYRVKAPKCQARGSVTPATFISTFNPSERSSGRVPRERRGEREREKKKEKRKEKKRGKKKRLIR